jgi:hypothetical protein
MLFSVFLYIICRLLHFINKKPAFLFPAKCRLFSGFHIIVVLVWKTAISDFRSRGRQKEARCNHTAGFGKGSYFA